MIPIGMGLAFAAYTVGAWGYCLNKGFSVTFLDLFKTTWPGTVNVKSSTSGTSPVGAKGSQAMTSATNPYPGGISGRA